jgi:hypothetical protein
MNSNDSAEYWWQQPLWLLLVDELPDDGGRVQGGGGGSGWGPLAQRLDALCVLLGRCPKAWPAFAGKSPAALARAVAKEAAASLAQLAVHKLGPNAGHELAAVQQLAKSPTVDAWWAALLPSHGRELARATGVQFFGGHELACCVAAFGVANLFGGVAPSREAAEQRNRVCNALTLRSDTPSMHVMMMVASRATAAGATRRDGGCDASECVAALLYPSQEARAFATFSLGVDAGADTRPTAIAARGMTLTVSGVFRGMALPQDVMIYNAVDRTRLAFSERAKQVKRGRTFTAGSDDDDDKEEDEEEHGRRRRRQ